MVATHCDPCPRCGATVGAPVPLRPHDCEPAGRDLIVARVRVLRRIRARRRVTVGVVADYPDRWWADVFGLTDVDAEVEP